MNMHRDLISAALETLEMRRLLSATLENGVLVVTGTVESDHMVISLHHEDHTMLDVGVNDETTTFNIADITGGVQMIGLSGKDHMSVDETEGAIDLNVTMNGGSGRDLMHGGSGDDDLAGGNGK